MGSNGQAMDIVKYYTENPIETEGKRITFYVSQTFNFLQVKSLNKFKRVNRMLRWLVIQPAFIQQSSKVLSFTPSPVGKEGYLDLMAIAKKFGTVLYSLFLPSVVNK